jgi:hypothetical protein
MRLNPVCLNSVAETTTASEKIDWSHLKGVVIFGSPSATFLSSLLFDEADKVNTMDEDKEKDCPKFSKPLKNYFDSGRFFVSVSQEDDFVSVPIIPITHKHADPNYKDQELRSQ